MDSVFQRQLHAYTLNGAIEFDDVRCEKVLFSFFFYSSLFFLSLKNEPLPDDDLELPPELTIGQEEEDAFVASLQDVQWPDIGLQTFLATLPPKAPSQ